MFNVGTGELLVILLVALIVLGPDKLPDTARKIGNVVGELRRMSQGFQNEVRKAMDEATPQTTTTPTPTDATGVIETTDAAATEVADATAELPPQPPKLESVPDQEPKSKSDDSAA